MLGQPLLLHIIKNIPAGPGQQRPQGPGAAHRIQDGHGASVVGLTAAHATRPATHLQIEQGPVQGFHLAELVVELEIGELSGFPQAPMEGLHPRRTQHRLNHPQIEAEQRTQLFGVEIRLRGEIAGVDPDHRQPPTGSHFAQLADQVQQHRRLDAEAGRQCQTLAEGFGRPAEPGRGIQGLQQRPGRLRIQGTPLPIGGQILQGRLNAWSLLRRRTGCGVSRGRKGRYRAIITLEGNAG